MKYRRLTGKDLGAYIKSCKKDIIKRELSHKIGMTENGLNSALSRESLRLSVFQDICLYAFKHTGMVELKHSGADWLDIRNQAGHESLDQTIEYTMELMKEGSRHIREKAPKL